MCVADAPGAPCATGDVVTPGVGAALVVLLANGLVKGLSLCEKRVTSGRASGKEKEPEPGQGETR